jgi:hypothetical protein
MCGVAHLLAAIVRGTQAGAGVVRLGAASHRRRRVSKRSQGTDRERQDDQQQAADCGETPDAILHNAIVRGRTREIKAHAAYTSRMWWRVPLLALAMTMNANDKPASVKADLVFLTREGCVNTPDMVNNLDDALKSLGWPTDYQYIDIAKLPKTDARSGYPTPTVLWKGKDLFGMSVPKPPFPEPA